MSMGHVDAYRLWLMNALDDPYGFFGRLAEHSASVLWRGWLEEHVCMGMLEPF